MPVTLRSYAKINLGLAIGPTRPDGFHSLATLYQTIGAHDLVRISVTADGGEAGAGSRIQITSNDRRIPLDARNTVWKALDLALAVPGREGLRVRAHIEKRLPIQGGLGGGSGNAVAALLGLEREIARQQLAAPLAGDERLRMAIEVGSDVPLFLLGGAVLGLGRGEDVVPLGDMEPLIVVVALPEKGVSTPAAFRAWDVAQDERGLTQRDIADRLSKLSRALAAAWCERHATGVLYAEPAPRSAPQNQDLAGTLLSTLVQTGILLNDFEEVVFRQHPLLEQIKRALAGESASKQAYSALSGSGSAVFGLYADDGQARAAEERLNALGIRSMRTHTMGRGEYWDGMVVEESDLAGNRS